MVRLRRRASEFFEDLSAAELVRKSRRSAWISDWLGVADSYRTFAEEAFEKGSIDIPREAWLCSFTAIEVARTLSCPGDVSCGELASKIGLGLTGIGEHLKLGVERVKIDCFDQTSLNGLFLPAFPPGSSAPVVICIGDGEIDVVSMMGRLLPVSFLRTVSLLVVDAGDSLVRRAFKPEQVLQCWLDYLETRPDVDARRIAIYGEGAGAGYVSSLALSDRRIVAAVGDGGLSASMIRRASVHWMTGVECATRDGHANDPLPSLHVPCPILMIVGSRSMLGEQDALDLQAEYRKAGTDCSVVVPNCISHPLGEVENFVAVDDFVRGWFRSKLGYGGELNPVTFL